MKKNFVINITVLTLLVIVALIIVILTSEFKYYIEVLGIIVTIITTFISFYTLQFRESKSLDESKSIQNIENIEAEFEKLSKKLIKTENKDSDKISGAINELSQEIKKIYSESKAQQNEIHNPIYERIKDDLLKIKKNLTDETKILTRYSSFNLSIGFSISLLGIGILLLSFDLIDPSKDTYDNLLIMLPRLSLSIFVELISFFFLRIYKKSLEDTKYYINEKLNVDMKLLALKTALFDQSDKETKNEILLMLSKTERNFILKNGESTIDINREKIDNEANQNIINLLNTILNKK